MLYDKRWDENKVIVEDWRKLILQGAELIERDGLCKFVQHNARGEHCMAGAIMKYEDDYKSGTYWEALDALNDSAKAQGWDHFVSFNNAPLTTQNDVVTFMREVATA